MKAIKIDVKRQVIELVAYDGSLDQLYAHLECDCVATAYYRKNGDVLFIDDNGLLIDHPIGAFRTSEYPQVLSGHGLIVGSDEEGDSTDCKSHIMDIHQIVEFMPVQLLKGIPTQPVYIPLSDSEFKDFITKGELPLGKKPTNPQ